MVDRKHKAIDYACYDIICKWLKILAASSSKYVTNGCRKLSLFLKCISPKGIIIWMMREL